MGIFSAVGDFLFGKNPDIFDENGGVSHKLPKKKWDAWHQRTKLDPQHNWRNHSGISSAPKAEVSQKSQ